MQGLGVILLTYDRMDYTKTTIKSFLNNIKTKEKIHFHIADDGSGTDYVNELIDYVGDFGIKATSSNSNRGGYGANYNMATQAIHYDCDLVFVLEDDWELRREFNLDQYCKVIRENKGIDAIRFGYIGYTQELKAKFVSSHGEQFLLLDPDSPEPHIFAGHPRLESVKYQREVGEWPLNVDPGTTEFMVAHIPRSRRGVAWPIDLVHPRGDLFYHIGTIQARSDQK